MPNTVQHRIATQRGNAATRQGLEIHEVDFNSATATFVVTWASDRRSNQWDGDSPAGAAKWRIDMPSRRKEVMRYGSVLGFSHSAW